MLLADALALFLDQLRADGRSKNTIDQYHRHASQFASWALSLGLPDDIDEVDHIVVARFLGSPSALLKADGTERAVVTVNCLRSSLKAWFAYLFDADVLPKNPGRLIKRARCGQAPPRGLSKAEQSALMKTLADAEGVGVERDYALFALLLATGMRVGTAVALDAEDLDFDERLIEVRVAKGGRPQLIKVSEEIAAHLRRFVGERREGAVFVGRGGGRVSTRHVGRRFKRWLEAAGVKRRVTVHGLRHSFAIALYRETRDIFAVQRALCHASILSSAHYARSADSLIESARA